MDYASAPWFLAYASASAIDAVYGDGPDALVASPLAPTGRATPVDGGVRVSGRWPFASGGHHCDWFLCRVVLEGGREQRLVLLPTYEVARLDTWRPNGLSGTGSGDVAVDDVFVPSERVVAFGQGPRRWSEPLYSFPHHGLACGSAAIALGIAQDALDTFVTLAAAKKPAGSSRRLAEREAVQLQVARAEAELGAARAFLHQATGDVWDDVLQHRLVAPSPACPAEAGSEPRLPGRHRGRRRGAPRRGVGGGSPLVSAGTSPSRRAHRDPAQVPQ